MSDYTKVQLGGKKSKVTLCGLEDAVYRDANENFVIHKKIKDAIGGGGGGTSVDWKDITNKPQSFTPTKHNHTVSEITDFPNLSDVATSGDYNDLSNKPTIPKIPTLISEFKNDVGYLTQHQSLEGYATEDWVEDKHYLTEHQDISGKQDKLTAGANIRIVNNVISASGGEGGTSDYNELDNKPSINGNTLTGDNDSSQLGLASAEHSHTKSDISDFPTLLKDLMGVSSTVNTTSTLGGVFWVQSFSITGVNISGNNYLSNSYSLGTKSGYTPFAIVGYEASGNNVSYANFYRILLSGIGSNTGTLEIGVRNTSTTASTRITGEINVKVLWVKTA